jgi:hypothetical protein
VCVCVCVFRSIKKDESSSTKLVFLHIPTQVSCQENLESEPSLRSSRSGAFRPLAISSWFCALQLFVGRDADDLPYKFAFAIRKGDCFFLRSHLPPPDQQRWDDIII